MSSDSEALRNLIHREVLRVLDRRRRRTPCIVDSYSPELHAVKVRLQPEDTISGWLQIDQLATGDSFGVQTAPNIGDPGWAEFHEADGRAGNFVAAVSNDKFPPVPIQAGEFLVKTKWGGLLYFKNDGTFTIDNGNGAKLVFDGSQIQVTGTFTGPAGAGEIDVGSPIVSSADITAEGISLKTHRHTNVQTGGSTSGPPV